MNAKTPEIESLLYVDVGSITTRATYFEVVNGKYRLVATGQAPSTAGAPFQDVREGVRLAIDALQGLTGYTLLEQEALIVPARAAGVGVDAFAFTFSVGEPLRVVALGLLEDVSLESAVNLAATTYSQVWVRLSLNDHRTTEARIDSILKVQPDLVIVAGGTEGGATKSVLRLIEAVGLSCFLTQKDRSPEVLYAGNTSMQEGVTSSLAKVAKLTCAANIRPGLEAERLNAAQAQIAALTARIRSRQIPGLSELGEWAGGEIYPTAAAFGRIIRFLSKVHTSPKGVLGIDIGAASTTVAAALAGELSLRVYPDLSLGDRLPKLLEKTSIHSILRWIPFDIGESDVREYVYNKSLHPQTLPATAKDMALEQAFARQILSMAVAEASRAWDNLRSTSSGEKRLNFEPILACGSVLTCVPKYIHALMMILDGIQPIGTTTVVLDQNHITAGLGAFASRYPEMAVQVLDSNAFLPLGTVISPVGQASPGSPILNLKMKYEDGHEIVHEVKQGAIEIIPLAIGQTAQMQLHPYHRFDVGMGGPGHSGKLRVVGGAVGVVIDGRGRPLKIPQEPARRIELLKKWYWMSGY